MVTPEQEKDDSLTRQIGFAFVLWSEIEGLWSRIFRHLLFFGFKLHLFGQPPEPDGGVAAKDERAAAIWDAVLSSAGQMDLIRALAPLVLTTKERKPILEDVLTLVERTDKTRGHRNSLAHSSFERKFHQTVTQLTHGVEISVQPLGIGLSARAHHRIRGKDPYTELPKIIEEFQRLLSEIQSLEFWLASQPDVRPTDAIDR